eukprot:GEMP01119101.1.p1 GENE.GEMP01119101.1~~GEMP01119101.1.p1  ORF type:complete len:118 (-),score=19.83 GEMP01119101.1:213-566(-)
MVAYATLKLIFVNDGATQPEIQVPLNLCTKDLSARICQEAWPEENVPPLDQVDHLRLFCGGKELDMSKTLEEAKITIYPDFATPVHVSVAEKPAPGAVSGPVSGTKGTSPRCYCTIL